MFEEQYPLVENHRFDDTNSATTQTVVTGDSRTRRVDHLFVSSNDTVDRSFNLGLSSNDWDYVVLCTVLVPAGAGWDPAIRPVDVLPLILSTLDGLVLAGNCHLYVDFLAPVTAGKVVGVQALGGYL
jgi:hypothetical protein